MKTEGFEERCADAYCFSGFCYARINSFTRAVDDLTEAIRLNGKCFGYYYIRAGAYFRLEERRQKAVLDDIPSKDLRDSPDLSKAVADYTRALELHPRFVYAYYNRARALSSQMKLAPAIKDFNMTVKLDPHHASAFFNRGMCYQKKVRNDWMKSYELCPKPEVVGFVRQINTMLRYPENLITPRR